MSDDKVDANYRLCVLKRIEWMQQRSIARRVLRSLFECSFQNHLYNNCKPLNHLSKCWNWNAGKCKTELTSFSYRNFWTMLSYNHNWHFNCVCLREKECMYMCLCVQEIAFYFILACKSRHNTQEENYITKGHIDEVENS